jgi:cation diffusion facilitator family transporter
MRRKSYDFYRAYSAALRHVIKARFGPEPAAHRRWRAIRSLLRRPASQVPIKHTDRDRQVRQTLIIILGLNLLVTAVKFVIGAVSGSLAITADAIHSLLDASSNIVGLIAVGMSARPPDTDHPYGHRKYELLATLGIGALLVVAAYEIGRGVVDRLLGGGEPLEITSLTIGIMAGTFVINLVVVTLETRAGRRLNSPILLADAEHTRVDLLITLTVIASLIGSTRGWPWLDPLVALGVVVMLLRVALDIFRDSTSVLTDTAVVNPDRVAELARRIPGVRHVRGIRSRGSATAAHLDLSIQVNPTLNTAQAHEIADQVEQRIIADVPGIVEVLVHIEPAPVERPPWKRVVQTVRLLADTIGINIHNVRLHTEPDESLTLTLHVEVNADLTLAEAHTLVDAFEAKIRANLPEVGAIVTHIDPMITELQLERGVNGDEDTLRRQIIHRAEQIVGPGLCQSVTLHRIGRKIMAALTVMQPADQSILESHRIAEMIRSDLLTQQRQISTVLVHVEPLWRAT